VPASGFACGGGFGGFTGGGGVSGLAGLSGGAAVTVVDAIVGGVTGGVGGGAVANVGCGGVGDVSCVLITYVTTAPAPRSVAMRASAMTSPEPERRRGTDWDASYGAEG
jgi:hypothetical protein